MLGLCDKEAYSIVLIFYLILLLLSSVTVYLTAMINSLVFLYVFLVLFRHKPNKLKRFLILSSIGNLLTFEAMVASYAELLVWEHILHVLFYVIAYYYCFHSTFKLDESIRRKPFFDFKTIGYMSRNNM